MTTALYQPYRKCYLEATVSGDVVLDAQPIELGYGRSAETITWLPAQWVGAPGITREVRTSAVVDMSTLPQRVALSLFFRVTDSPETEGDRLGTIYVGG